VNGCGVGLVWFDSAEWLDRVVARPVCDVVRRPGVFPAARGGAGAGGGVGLRG
jgi:hypothetical protein